MEKRFIDNGIWLKEIADIVSKGNTVSLNISGNSMLPLLKAGRDRVLLGKVSSNLVKGDIVLYQRNNGEYILHRIIDIDSKGLYLSGDAQSVTEGPVNPEQVVAKVISAERKGKWIKENSLKWNFYKYLRLKTKHLRKLLSFIILIYTKTEKRIKHK